MLNTLDSFFEEMYYIEYEKGHELIEKFIHEKDNDYRKNLEEFFRRSAVYVRKKCYLDIHYILRLMVEYYQFCKKREI